MSHPVPEGLPVWVQALVYIGTVTGAAVAAFLGWRKKAPSAADAPNTLIAGDIMDTRPMRDLVVEVARLGDHMGQLANAEDRRAAADDRKSAALDRNTDAMRDLVLTIERKMQ